MTEGFESTSSNFWLEIIYEPGTLVTPYYRVLDIESHNAPGSIFDNEPKVQLFRDDVIIERA